MRPILHAAAFAIESSPALRTGADSVAPVHGWGTPSPHDRPIRPFRARLLLAAAIATALVAVIDFALYARAPHASCEHTFARGRREGGRAITREAARLFRSTAP
jgi:hypothetical protein